MMPPPRNDDPQQSLVLNWIARPGCAVIVVLVVLGAVHGMLGQRGPAIAATAAALAVSVVGIAWVVLIEIETITRRDRKSVV